MIDGFSDSWGERNSEIDRNNFDAAGARLIRLRVFVVDSSRLGPLIQLFIIARV
jgi:hypothetical protein